MSLARNVFVQSALTLASRVLGFARDLALNARFGGQGPLMDAWATAQMLPNLFRRLFAEGAFAQAFVPLFAHERATAGSESAERMASQVLAFMMAVVVMFTILAEIALPFLMPMLLSAYADDAGSLAMATLMAQLAMPYLACMTLASLLSGVLNTLGRFALSAGAPVLLNLCTIVPLVIINEPQAAALFASAAVTLAGILQAGLLWWGVRRLGVRLAIVLPALSTVVRRVVVLAVPGAIAGGAMQVNSLVSQVLSGSDEGARGVLYNADRLYQLPLGLIGVAVGAALVPRLSSLFARSDTVGAQRTMDDGIALAMAFTIPAALALFVMPYLIIDGAVTRGAFTSEDARRTAEVLRHFAWGIPAFVLAKVLTPPFFARQKTGRPMQFAIVTVVANTIIGSALWFWLPTVGVDGAIGLAVGTSLAGWLNVALLSGTLAVSGVYRPGARLIGRLIRLSIASVVMAAVLAVCAARYPDISEALGSKEATLAIVSLGGLVVFVCLALALRAVSMAEISGALRREPKSSQSALPLGGED
ncbi:MAG: murein biosynthesis integral membrane protein MurJ [Alphaproteobacteria bacterium]|nr:murein biosynthesis integral membrane protein MurJ [Alphaproteobacteria bacterium]